MSATSVTESPRSNMYMVEPEALKLITDKEDPLYDPRVDLPVEENMVLNIMHQGIIQNIQAVKRGEDYVVITGRQRVKAALEANKKLRRQGKEPIRIPVVLGRGDEADQLGVLISENELRQNDSPIAKAEKCKKFLDMGRTEQEAAIIFGVTPQTIKNWMEIVGLCAFVKKAVDRDLISATAAAKLSGLSLADQKEAAEDLIEAAEKAGKKRATIGKAAAKAGKKPGLRKKKEIKEMLDILDEPWAIATLKWVLGERKNIEIVE